MAMHQANYIPWIGYFHKMLKSDVFVYLDVVQYPRGKSFSARNKIKTANGETVLTVPISVPKGQDHKVLYTDIQFADQKWKKKHKKTILLNYKKAPFFDEVFTLYTKELDRSHALLDLNINLIEAIAEYLNIDTQRIKLSNILSKFGQKTDLIIEICKALDANTYLSGTGGGKEYNDEEQLSVNNIRLLYDDFQHPVYEQLWGYFISKLSILDFLFNFGAEGGQLLKK